MIIGCFGWFEKEGKILLQKRSGNDRLANQWGLPGGGKEKGEDMYNCLKREIKEEADVDINGATLMHIHETSNGTDREILLTQWRIHDWTGEPKVMEPEEAQAYEWFALDDLPDDLLPNLRFVIQCIGEGKPYSKG